MLDPATRPHIHDTIGEAGECPECRDWNVKLISDSPRLYALIFPDADAFAVVPAFTWEVAIENAWAIGCNPGGRVGSGEVSAAAVEGAAIPTCVLLTGPAATAAMDQLKAAEQT